MYPESAYPVSEKKFKQILFCTKLAEYFNGRQEKVNTAFVFLPFFLILSLNSPNYVFQHPAQANVTPPHILNIPPQYFNILLFNKLRDI